MDVLVSVILPVYNVEPYIEKCLFSIVNQTYRSIELVIIDDCGTDNSIGLAETLLRKELACSNDITYKIIKHSKNLGLSAARNTGIKEASGKWVYFIDSDDWIIPECIQLMVERTKQYPSSEMVFAGAHVTNGSRRFLDYSKKALPQNIADRDRLQKMLLNRFDLGMASWNRLTLKSWIVENKVNFVDVLSCEDEVWNFLNARYITNACFVNYNTYIYNVHAGSMATNLSREQMWSVYFDIWKKIAKAIGGYNSSQQARGLFKFIFEITTKGYPSERKMELSSILFCLSRKLSFPQNILMLCQATFAFFNYKYSNYRISSKLTL